MAGAVVNRKPRKQRTVFTVRAGQGINMISVPKDVAALIRPGEKFQFELTEDGFRYRLYTPPQPPALPLWLRQS